MPFMSALLKRGKALTSDLGSKKQQQGQNSLASGIGKSIRKKLNDKNDGK